MSVSSSVRRSRARRQVPVDPVDRIGNCVAPVDGWVKTHPVEDQGARRDDVSCPDRDDGYFTIDSTCTTRIGPDRIGSDRIP